ncbi:DUF397 domain-containing protein [Streptomyces sp. NPDC004647]|uniref:DUF397 domain-containing protein n=1 Tax=Streptomyces sp. NPDC004647 TaxID=3154671 RepID=UPI0033A3D4AF
MNSAASPRHSDGLTWFKSSYSGDEGGACIEVAVGTGTVHVRDSKNPGGPVLTLTPDAWADFVRLAAGS